MKSTIQTSIISALKANQKGLTCEEIEMLTGRTHQTISGNLRHLVKRDMVKHNDMFGTNTSGRKAKKWALT